MICFGLASAACILVICLLVRSQLYWWIRGVPQSIPVPILGDNVATFFQLKSLTDMVKDMYFAFPGKRFAGIYQMTRPMLMIRDPGLIKQLAVKDFDFFTDHMSFVPGDNDVLWSNNLFALKGSQWHDMRALLTPAFTSKKMRLMFELMSDAARQFVDFYDRRIQDLETLELKDAFTRYTNDVIATCAFGVQCDSLQEPSNEFYRMGKEVTDVKSFTRISKIFLHFLLPQLAKACKFVIIPEDVSRFFRNLVGETLKVREERGIVRPDMLNLLMEARRESHQDISDLDITSQCLVFFLAGFESTASMMCFMAYELAVNPEIQSRLREEIEGVKRKSSKLTYSSLRELRYMDMVLNETMRKWPAAFLFDRLCVKEYTIEGKRFGEEDVRLVPGDAICFPVAGLHHDPEYFEDPHVFDPDRFSEARKPLIQPYTFLPFGVGPRGCIGYRFAFMKAKILFFNLLSDFVILPSERTQIPLKISKRDLMLASAGGFWLTFKKRI